VKIADSRIIILVAAAGEPRRSAAEVSQMRFVLLLGVVFTLTGCSPKSGRPVSFVVPKGHAGPLWVVHDPEASELTAEGDGYRAAFPSGGLLRVASMRPFERWEVVLARYDDGTPLPYLIKGMAVAPETVGLWSAWSGQTEPGKRDYIVWFVGTEAQFRAFGEDGHDQPPVGK
jgi:hypothetical protein